MWTKTATAQVQSSAARNPFPGPRPYVDEQSDVFFGRARVITELTALILSSQTVLLHGRSGNGKSSLLSAGVLPALKARPFEAEVLATVRFAADEPIQTQGAPTCPEDGHRAGENPFVATIGRSVLPPERADISGLRLTTILGRQRPTNRRRISILVLDQFEEIFREPGLWQERADFFAQMREAVDQDHLLRIVIGMRSDYLANFLSHENVQSSGTAVKYLLESLTEQEAALAITEAFKRTEVALAQTELDSLIDALLTLRRTNTAGRVMRSQYVNLIQLQILCRRLWQQRADAQAHSGSSGAATDPGMTRGHQSASTSGDSSLETTVSPFDQSMMDFVDEAIASVVSTTGFDDRALRVWVQGALITPNRERRVVSGVKNDFDIPDQVLTELQEARLVNIETRGTTLLAELVHDSMVDAVIDANERWTAARRRSRRKRQIASAAVLAAVIIGLFSFPPERDKDLLVASGPKSNSAELLTTFKGQPDRELTVVELDISAPYRSRSQAYQLKVVTVGPKNQVGGVVGSKNINVSARGHIESVLTVAVTADQRYGVSVTPADGALSLNYLTVRAAKLGISAEDWKSSTEQRLRASSSGVAVAFPPSGLMTVNSLDSVPRVVGGHMIYDRVSGVFLKKADDTYAYLEGGSGGGRLTLRAVNPSDALTPNVTRHLNTDDVETVPIRVSPTQLPAYLITRCSAYADIHLDTLENGEDLEEFYSPGSSAGTGYVISSDMADRYLTIDATGQDEPVECDVSLNLPTERPISTVGVTQVVLAAGTAVSARAITLHDDAFLTVPSNSAGLIASLACGSGPATTAPAGSRLVGFVTGGTRCALVLRHAIGLLTKVTVPVQIASVPQVAAPAVHR